MSLQQWLTIDIAKVMVQREGPKARYQILLQARWYN